MHAAGGLEGAWKAVMNWYQPQGHAERDQLEKLEKIGIQGNENSNLFFARAEGKLNVLSSLGIHTSDRGVTRILTRRLPSDVYDVEQRTSLLQPVITRSEMEEIVRTPHANRKTEELEERKIATVASMAPAPLAGPHAFSVGGGFQGRYGGGGLQKQQRQYEQQQRQHDKQ